MPVYVLLLPSALLFGAVQNRRLKFHVILLGRIRPLWWQAAVKKNSRVMCWKYVSGANEAALLLYNSRISKLWYNVNDSIILMYIIYSFIYTYMVRKIIVIYICMISIVCGDNLICSTTVKILLKVNLFSMKNSIFLKNAICSEKSH